MKLGATGIEQWEEFLGGTGADLAYSIAPSGDGGYVVGGYTQSDDGQVRGLHPPKGQGDIWMVKLASDNGISQIQRTSNDNIFLSPNPGTGIEKLSYTLLTSSAVNLTVFNQLGQQVHSFSVAKEDAGTHTHDLDLSDLPSGHISAESRWMGGRSWLKCSYFTNFSQELT